VTKLEWMAVWHRDSLHLVLVEIMWDSENSHQELPKAIVTPTKLSLWVAVLMKIQKKNLPQSQHVRSEGVLNTENVLHAFMGNPTLSRDSEESQ